MIEAQRASILVPHDHRHINQIRARRLHDATHPLIGTSGRPERSTQDLSAGIAIATTVRGGSWIAAARSDCAQLEVSYPRRRQTSQAIDARAHRCRPAVRRGCPAHCLSPLTKPHSLRTNDSWRLLKMPNCRRSRRSPRTQWLAPRRTGRSLARATPRRRTAPPPLRSPRRRS